MAITEAIGHCGRSARPPAARARVPLRQLLRVASAACGIQFGWALQLSLLTPYVQELGIPHAWACVIWLCGPLSGLLVQPLVGHMSDRCTSRFGRRRPFIVAGAVCIAVSVLIIGHSADIGWLLGDRGAVRPRAVAAVLVELFSLISLETCGSLLAEYFGMPLPKSDENNLLLQRDRSPIAGFHRAQSASSSLKNNLEYSTRSASPQSNGADPCKFKESNGADQPNIVDLILNKNHDNKK